MSETRIISFLPMDAELENKIKQISDDATIHLLHDHKPTVQRVLTTRKEYTVNGHDTVPFRVAEALKKNSLFEIQDLKETLLPKLFNIESSCSLEEYKNMASQFLGKSSPAFTYALEHLPLILIHSALRTVHYTNEQETPLGILLSRLINLDNAIEVEEQLSKLAVEDPGFYGNMLRFISIRYMHFITELGIEKEMFFVNPHDYSSGVLHAHGTPEITGIMQAYYDKTLIMNVPARTPDEPLYKVKGQPEPFYEPIVTEYKVIQAKSPVAAEDYILETHDVEEEQYCIQGKAIFPIFQDLKTFSKPDSILQDLEWRYDDLVRKERFIAESLGFPNITSAMQDPKMSYLLKHYSLQEIVELDFDKVYHDPFEEVFGDDAKTFLYKEHHSSSYALFNQFEIYRKHQYYMRLIDEIQSAVDDSDSPVLPLHLALFLSYDDILDEKFIRELNMLKQREKAIKGQ